MHLVEAVIAVLVAADKTGEHHCRAGRRRVEPALRDLDVSGPLQHLTLPPVQFQKAARVHVGEEQAAAPQHTRHALEAARQIIGGEQIVQAVVGACYQIERFQPLLVCEGRRRSIEAGGRQVAHIAQDEHDPASSIGSLGLSAGDGQHRLRAVEPNHIPAAIGEDQRQRAGAAGQVERAAPSDGMVLQEFAEVLAHQHGKTHLAA